MDIDLKNVDRVLAEKVIGYKTEDSILTRSYWTLDCNNKIIYFNPTANIEDAFKLINKAQEDGYAWSMQMNNLENEVEVVIGTGYSSSKSIPLAISMATLRNYKLV